MAEEDDGPPGSPWRGVVILLIIVIVGAGVWFVIQQLRQSAAIQDCIASGRTNCAPINAR